MKQAGSSPAEKVENPSSQASNAAFSDMLNQMFDSGIEVQKNYQKSMDGIFEGYFSNLNPSNTK